MTLSLLTTKNQYAGDGVTVSFAFSFKVFATSEVRVTKRTAGVETLMTLGVDYTIAGNNWDSGGNVVFGVAPASGDAITIKRVLPLTQATAFRNHDDYFPEDTEDQHDREIMIALQVQETIDRCIKLPETETAGLTVTLPMAATRAGGYLGFDGSGNVAVVAGTAGGLLIQEAANTLAQRNGTNPQTWRIYNTYTDASNYERGAVTWAANILRFQTEQAGTGSARNLTLGASGAASVNISVNGGVVWSWASTGHYIANVDNTYDIGNSGANRPRSIYWGTQALGPDGTAANPTFAFASQVALGFYRSAASFIGISDGTQAAISFVPSGAQIILGASGVMSWANSADSTNGTADVKLFRDAAATLALRNGATGQTIRVYNTFTDAANYERLGISWAANICSVITQNAGTGTARQLLLGTPNGSWSVGSGTGSWSPGADNIQDIGIAATNRVRSIYWGTQAFGPDGSNTNPAYAFASSTNSGLYFSSIPRISVAGTLTYSFGSTQFFMHSDSAQIQMGASQDCNMARDAAAVLAHRNGTNAQTVRIYGTFTDSSNYERFQIVTSAGTTVLSQTQAGTGTARALDIGTVGATSCIFFTNNTDRWLINSSGHFVANSDNAVDIGAAGANRPRTIYTGTSYIGPVYNPASDNTATIGSSALRFASIAAMAHNFYATVSDANVTYALNSSGLVMGPGGATGVDITFGRFAVNGWGYGVFSPSGTLSGSPADLAAFHISPSLAGAFTVTRFAYLKCLQTAGAATVTDGALAWFDAAVGTHKALAANAAVAVTITSVGPTGAQTTIQGWIKMNINGTLRYVPFW